MNIELLWKKLNKRSSKEIDELVKPIVLKEYKTYDCTTCGKCCQKLHPAFTQEDIAKIVMEEGVQDVTQLLYKDRLSSVYYLKDKPCAFLQKKKCGIYQNRPASCADYPHIHQPHFKYRKKSIKENYKICPIVQNVLYELDNITS